MYDAEFQGKYDAVGHALFYLEDVLNNEQKSHAMKLYRQSMVSEQVYRGSYPQKRDVLSWSYFRLINFSTYLFSRSWSLMEQTWLLSSCTWAEVSTSKIMIYSSIVNEISQGKTKVDRILGTSLCISSVARVAVPIWFVRGSKRKGPCLSSL